MKTLFKMKNILVLIFCLQLIFGCSSNKKDVSPSTWSSIPITDDQAIRLHNNYVRSANQPGSGTTIHGVIFDINQTKHLNKIADDIMSEKQLKNEELIF